MPAWSLVRRVLEHVLEHADVSLGVWLVERHHGSGLVADSAQHGIDHLDVRAMPVDEDQLVPPVMDQAPADVVEDLVQRLSAEGDGSRSGARLAQMLRRIPGPEWGRVRNV